MGPDLKVPQAHADDLLPCNGKIAFEFLGFPPSIERFPCSQPLSLIYSPSWQYLVIVIILATIPVFAFTFNSMEVKYVTHANFLYHHDNHNASCLMVLRNSVAPTFFLLFELFFYLCHSSFPPSLIFLLGFVVTDF